MNESLPVETVFFYQYNERGRYSGAQTMAAEDACAKAAQSVLRKLKFAITDMADSMIAHNLDVDTHIVLGERAYIDGIFWAGSAIQRHNQTCGGAAKEPAKEPGRDR